MLSDTGGVNVTSKAKSRQIIFIVVLVLLIFLAHVPGAFSEKGKDTSEDESETFSQSPTNHEKVLSKKKQTTAITEKSGDDDYWIGSHKLEFKPHPLLMPSTQAPNVQIPIPLIEMGLPPTTSIPAILSDEDNDNASSNEQKLKVKPRKSRDRRKKSRHQRLLTHRTLGSSWANVSANNLYLRALQKHPQLLQSPSYYVGQQQPVIITSEGVTPVSNSLYLPSQATKNDDSFHGTSTTWSINHPGNNLQSYASGHINSQENQIVQNYPSSPIQQLPFGFSQLGQTQQFVQQYSSPHATPAYQPLPIAPSAPDTFADNIFMNSHQMSNHYLPQQQVSTGAGGSSGPVIVYVSSAGLTQPSAPSSFPMKALNHFNQNEIHVDLSKKPPYPMTGPGPTSSASNNNLISGKPTTNPQYFRNNFIRMFMDKLASVGKVLPIPFVTKYTSSQNAQQGFNAHGHFHRRM